MEASTALTKTWWKVHHFYKPKGNKIKMTLFTVQGKPILVCVCCLTLPIFFIPGKWDLSAFGERRGTKGREMGISCKVLAKKPRLERKAKSWSPQVPTHPLRVAFLPLLGRCFQAHDTCSSPLAEPPETMPANPAGLALLLPFSPVF